MFPYHSAIDVQKLGLIFKNTATSYKFYWFYTLLQVVKTNRKEVEVLEMLVRMVVCVWHPIHYFKLSFGTQDKLGRAAILALKTKELALNINDKPEKIIKIILDYITKNPRSELAKRIKSLKENVPYRFIRPWCESELKKGLTDAVLIQRIQEIAAKNVTIPYHFKDETIVLHDDWFAYFQAHLKVMEDFCLWNLLNYVQKRNSNTPNIAGKLFPPNPKARQLGKARNFWKAIYQNTATPFRCIFSNELINVEEYALDHFIPWSFVTHNQLWNLVPIVPNVNSQKSDKLPHLTTYFKKFGQTQYDVFQLGLKLKKTTLLEDYLGVVGRSLEEIKQLSQNDFIHRLENQIQPLAQIAQNMGFQKDWIYQK